MGNSQSSHGNNSNLEPQHHSVPVSPNQTKKPSLDARPSPISVEMEGEKPKVINSYDSAPSLQPQQTKQIPVRNRIQIAKGYSESPFVGSPLTLTDDTFTPKLSNTNQLPKPTDNIDIKLSKYARDTFNDNQPDTFPASLPKPSFHKNNSQNNETKTKEALVNPYAEPSGIPTIINWNTPATTVYVTGTFNGWKHKIPLQPCGNEFSTVVNFPPGIHHLKFIVDDEWKCSDDYHTATDQDGHLVNYLEADATDVVDREDNDFDGSQLNHKGNYPPSPPGEYCKEIPDFNLNPDFHANNAGNANPGAAVTKPPTLPPHLEKVILNANVDTDLNFDNNYVLPVPNHVVLNHLYACSIRDNVMAIAGTTRYRNKYITTVYYKPVEI